jgi:predicted house-cleaning NTP pyrophosphatase (Maf/HAM1 superfamily)
MSETQTALVLASSSPRRRDLLGRLHVAPTRIASPDIDETPRKGEVPRVYALRMAVEKARGRAPAGRDRDCRRYDSGPWPPRARQGA